MIELVPYLLLLVWPAPDQPGGLRIERVPEVYADAAACEAAAIAQVAAVRGGNAAHRCLPLPPREEFDRLFKQLDRRGPAASPERRP